MDKERTKVVGVKDIVADLHIRIPNPPDGARSDWRQWLLGFLYSELPVGTTISIVSASAIMLVEYPDGDTIIDADITYEEG